MFDPGLGRSPEEGNGNPLQYPCLGNPVDRGAWWATVHGITESDTTEHLCRIAAYISRGKYFGVPRVNRLASRWPGISSWCHPFQPWCHHHLGFHCGATCSFCFDVLQPSNDERQKEQRSKESKGFAVAHPETVSPGLPLINYLPLDPCLKLLFFSVKWDLSGFREREHIVSVYSSCFPMLTVC